MKWDHVGEEIGRKKNVRARGSEIHMHGVCARARFSRDDVIHT